MGMGFGVGGRNIYYRPYKIESPPSPTPPNPLFFVRTQEELLRLAFPYFISVSTSPLQVFAALQKLTFITLRGDFNLLSHESRHLIWPLPLVLGD